MRTPAQAAARNRPATPPSTHPHDMTAGEEPVLLEVRHVCKSFPGVIALDDVSFRVRGGTVHAVMGENGAGKSTLMKIIAGIHSPDSGELRLHGQRVRLDSPRDALERGIAMIHQELNLMAQMSVAENIWIRREPLNALGMISHRELHRRTRELFDRLGMDLDPQAQVSELSIANRQMIEIAKAVSYESELLIMDEPTSALTEKEAGHLFEIIRGLKAQGKGIIYITHKMNELFEIADEVSVFRDGKHIATAGAADVAHDDIIRMMVGREIRQIFPKQTTTIGPVVLSVRSLCLEGEFHDVSFDLHAGEILGVAGLIGSGRSKLAEAIFGVSPATSGRILLADREITIDSPRRAMERGIAFLTEDRNENGCFLALDILENLEISVLRRDFVRFGFVRRGAVQRACEAISRQLRVKTPDLRECILNLSGGNQQKVLIGRWLLTGPGILILDEPTRGIDVGAKAEIHQLISRLVAQGAAVLMISSELPEILGMSDRIMVMHAGRITGILDRSAADQVKIMELASR
jgi:inositol transport system ATP-binding protein